MTLVLQSRPQTLSFAGHVQYMHPFVLFTKNRRTRQYRSAGRTSASTGWVRMRTLYHWSRLYSRPSELVTSTGTERFALKSCDKIFDSEEFSGGAGSSSLSSGTQVRTPPETTSTFLPPSL